MRASTPTRCGANQQCIDLTEAEWTLMEQLWGAPGQTGRTLTDALHAETGWARSTTLTLLRRLTEKGAVRTEVRDGMHVYFPAVSREDAAARQTRDLLGRVYHGSLSLLVSAMTREETLSKAEIDELYAILDEMEAKQGDA